MWFTYMPLIIFLPSRAKMEDEMKVSLHSQRSSPQKNHL